MVVTHWSSSSHPPIREMRLRRVKQLVSKDKHFSRPSHRVRLEFLIRMIRLIGVLRIFKSSIRGSEYLQVLKRVLEKVFHLSRISDSLKNIVPTLQNDGEEKTYSKLGLKVELS